MKKFLSIILIIILAAALTACSQPAGTQLQGSNNAGAAPALQGSDAPLPVLNGYPQNVLPLYQPFSLLSSGFSYRTQDIYDVGKDIYTITYESTALEQDLFKYYSSLLTEKTATPSPSESASPSSSDDQADDTSTDSISGKIGGMGVQIYFLDNADNTTTVYLTLGLSKDKYVNSNPFFTGYPANLVDQFGVLTPQEATYEEQYYGGKSIHYITVYLTGVTQQEFANYYNKYASKPGFKQTTSDNRLSISWQDQGFNCSVAYTGGISSYITIDASKAG